MMLVTPSRLPALNPQELASICLPRTAHNRGEREGSNYADVDCPLTPFVSACCFDGGTCNQTVTPAECDGQGGTIVIGVGCSAANCNEGAAALVFEVVSRQLLPPARLSIKDSTWDPHKLH